jgi:hypothetical protein
MTYQRTSEVPAQIVPARAFSDSFLQKRPSAFPPLTPGLDPAAVTGGELPELGIVPARSSAPGRLPRHRDTSTAGRSMFLYVPAEGGDSRWREPYRLT